MAIYSEYRAKLYQHAFRKPRGEVAELNNVPPHLLAMLHERSSGKIDLTYGDIVDHLAPTFDEARTFSVLRVITLKHVLHLVEEGQSRIYKRSLAPEIIDFIYDKLPFDYFEIWDVIKELRSSTDEARKAEKPPEELKQDWQEFLNSIEPPPSEDGTTWNDLDLDF